MQVSVMHCIILLVSLFIWSAQAMLPAHKKIFEAAKEFDIICPAHSNFSRYCDISQSTIYQSIEAKAIVWQLLKDPSLFLSYLPPDLHRELFYFFGCTKNKINPYLDGKTVLIKSYPFRKEIFFYAFSGLKRPIQIRLNKKEWMQEQESVEPYLVVATDSDNKILKTWHAVYLFNKLKKLNTSSDNDLLMLISRNVACPNFYRMADNKPVLSLIAQKFTTIAKNTQIRELNWNSNTMTYYNYNCILDSKDKIEMMDDSH